MLQVLKQAVEGTLRFAEPAQEAAVKGGLLLPPTVEYNFFSFGKFIFFS